MIRTALSLRRRTVTALALLLTCLSSLAQTWTGGGNGVSWNQATNWNFLPVSGPGTAIQFNNAAPLTTNQNLGNPFVLNYLYSGGAGALTLNGNALDFQGSNATMQFNTPSATTLNTPVLLSSGTTVYAPDLILAGGVSGPGALTLGQGMTTLTSPGSWSGGTTLNGATTLRVATGGSLTGNVSFGFTNPSLLEFASAGAVTYSGSLQNAFYPSNIVRQSGAGTTLFNGVASNFYGTVEVTGGTLQSANANALGTSSTVQVQSGGTLQMTGNNALTGVQVMTIAPGGTLDANGFQQTTAIGLANTGTITLPAGSLLTAGGNTIWTGTSSGPGLLALAGFISMNPGTSLTHTGGTNQIGGQTSIYSSNVLPDTGLLHVSGGNLFHNGTDTVDTVLIDGGNLATTTFNVASTMDLQAGNLSGNVTVSGAFTKTTAGTGTTNSGIITLAGGGTVSAGVLDIGYNSSINGTVLNNATISIGPGSSLNGPVTNNGVVNVDFGTLAGATTSPGTINVLSGTVAGTVLNNGSINALASGSGNITANVSGPGNLAVTANSLNLSGTNSYSGGSTATNSVITGTTNAIQGAWALTGSVLQFTQNTSGTMAGPITGTGAVQVISGTGKVTLSGTNSYNQGVFIVSGDFGIGSNTAAGVGGTIQGSGNIKISAGGGARTVANPIILGTGGILEFDGTNNLTFTSAAPKSLSGVEQILHTSTATTTVAGTFLGQNTTAINVNAGQLVLGAAVNNGFRMDGAINVASGATLQMISNSPVKLGPTNLNGGTLIAPSGVAVPTGLALTATGNIQGRVSSEAGSLIEATGSLTLGDAASFGGFLSNGELRTQQHSVTLLDRNQAVLGSLTEVGTPSFTGVLTAANGVYVDFGRAITGYGTVAGINTLAKATIINGDAAGSSVSQQLDFTGYVKGLGTFTDVTFSGTFSPGLSPAIVPLNNVSLGSSALLLMEIGGLTPGSQHDQIDIGGVLALNGTLDVDLINGFNPSLGNVFNILDGTTSGTFNAFSFPGLNPGLYWDTSDLYTLGNLNIVPEPSAALLSLLAAGFLTRRRR